MQEACRLHCYAEASYSTANSRRPKAELQALWSVAFDPVQAKQTMAAKQDTPIIVV